MDRAAAAAAHAVDQIKAQFESLNSGFESLKTTFSAVVAVFAGGEIAAKLGEMAERAEAIRNSADVFNLSTQALQGLQVMAARAGVSAEQVQGQMATLEQRMRQAGEEGGAAAAKFNALGITTAQLRDPTFSVQDAMERLGESSNSSAALLALLGKRGEALIPVMRELARNHNAAAEAAKEVGALTDQEIAVLGRYHGQIQTVATEWQNFGSRILSQVAPALGELQQQLFNVLTAGERTTDLGEIARGVASEFLKWAAAAKDLVVDVENIFQIFGTYFGILGATIAAAATGDFARAKSIWSSGMADLVAIRKQNEDKIAANHEALAKALTAIDESILQPVDITAKYKTSGELPQVAGFAKLEKLSDRYAELEIANANKILDAMKKAAEEAASAQEEAQTGAIDRGIAAVQAAAKEHQITAKQELDETLTLLQAKESAEAQYYATRRTLAAGDEAELEAIDKQEVAAHNKILAEMQKAQETYSKAVQQQWQTIANGISNALDHAFTQMLNRGQSFTKSMESMFASMGESMIATLIKVGVQTEINAMISKATGQAVAKSNVMANAAQAASGAYASASEIPVVGWLLGPVAAAAAYAGALAFPTAEGGWVVPDNINPMTQLHGGEMVLPRDISGGLRAMIAAGGASEGGFSEHHTYNGAMHISALDAGSFAKMMNKPSNRRVVASALRRHVMRGGR